MIDIHLIIMRTMKIVPNSYDMNGEKFNCDCYLELTDKTYQMISNRFNITLEEGKKIVENYLTLTNGNV